jgi:hypothetical protein
MMIDSTQRKMNSMKNPPIIWIRFKPEVVMPYTHQIDPICTAELRHYWHMLSKYLLVSSMTSSKNRGEVQIKKASTLRPCRGIKTNPINQRTWSPKSETCNLNLSSHELHKQKTVLLLLNDYFNSLLSLPTISASFLRKMRKFGVFLSLGN